MANIDMVKLAESLAFGPKPVELDEFDLAVSAAFIGGNGDLESLYTVLASVKDRHAFESIFIGILAAATPKTVWAIALVKATESYKEYRPE